jgi:gamma-glutamylcyclotransferase (GGCT)/AIG2-like uncharacterized protein YtfP
LDGARVTEVFAYGTLRDAEYQQALFGRTLPTRPATLADWLVIIAPGGFLTLARAPGETVGGDLVTLDDGALELADAWEEVPLYERLPVEARAADGDFVPAYVYVRPCAAGERAPAGMLARLPRAEVLARIRAFRRDYDRISSERA